jgi:hypothetical protein
MPNELLLLAGSAVRQLQQPGRINVKGNVSGNEIVNVMLSAAVVVNVILEE